MRSPAGKVLLALGVSLFSVDRVLLALAGHHARFVGEVLRAHGEDLVSLVGEMLLAHGDLLCSWVARYCCLMRETAYACCVHGWQGVFA